MDGTELFKSTIKAFLDDYATKDKEFAERYATTTRTMDDVVTYIINQVKISGCAGFPREEIFGMALHCIDEPTLDVGKPIPCQIVLNHQPQLTEEEKAEAHKIALQRFQNEQYAKMQSQLHKPKPSAKKPATNAPSLFD